MDVLCIYYKRDKSYYDLHTYSSDKAYIQLKKACPEVVKVLEKVEPGCVIDNGKVGKDSSSKVVFTLFVKDGFKDPLDMGIELPYGTPYDYKTRKVTYFFKPIQK